MNSWFSDSSGSSKIPPSTLAEDSSMRPPTSPPEPPDPNYLASFPPLSPISSFSPPSHPTSSLPPPPTLQPTSPSSLASLYSTHFMTSANPNLEIMDFTSRSGFDTIHSTVKVIVPHSTQISLPLPNRAHPISSHPTTPESTQGLLQNLVSSFHPAIPTYATSHISKPLVPTTTTFIPPQTTLVTKLKKSSDKSLHRCSTTPLIPSTKPKVKIPQFVFQEREEIHKNYVVGKFRGMPPPFKHIQNVLSSLWN